MVSDSQLLFARRLISVFYRYYTWNPDGFASDIEFVPMLWGPTQTDDWDTHINSTISSLHVSHVLAFNEPQETSQSNLSPQDGAALWKQHVEPLKAQGILLGSPAPSSAPSGKTWISQWLDACDGGCVQCRFHRAALL